MRAMKKIILLTLIAAAVCFALAGCGSGSEESAEAEGTQIQVTAGEETIVEDGTYGTLELDASMSGTPESPTVIKAADGAAPVIQVSPGEFQNGEEEELPPSYGIHMVNVHDVVIEGLAVEGGTHGIIYESTQHQGDDPLNNITIKDCRVSGVVGVHGICVYAGNDMAPVQDLTVTGCEVSECKCGDSESLVLNGNIDGFEISGNTIHDNNNIGIDMIGFEGTAQHMEAEDPADLFEVDMVRNGKCFGNTVYNISADGNPAYYEDGKYDLCADGIYVDGGQDIEVCENFVFNCDIGIEVATEHSPDYNPLCKVSGVKVHDNIVADCRGWCGLCFGGYDRDIGFTENCEFYNNTFVDNGTQIGVQRSKDNKIYDNLFVGGESTIEFSGDCRQKDMINNFGRKVWCLEDGYLIDMMDTAGYDLSVLIPEECMEKQEVLNIRSQVLDGFASKIEGAGSSFVPDEAAVKIYDENKRAE